MTYEQAQLYIKIFILQHYDEYIEDIISNVSFKGEVFNLVCDKDGDWKFGFGEYVFWASKKLVETENCIMVNLEYDHSKDINILDYITLEEEHETVDKRID